MKNLSVCLHCKDALFFCNYQTFTQKNNKNIFLITQHITYIIIKQHIKSYKIIIFNHALYNSFSSIQFYATFHAVKVRFTPKLTGNNSIFSGLKFKRNRLISQVQKKPHFPVLFFQHQTTKIILRELSIIK